MKKQIKYLLLTSTLFSYCSNKKEVNPPVSSSQSLPTTESNQSIDPVPSIEQEDPEFESGIIKEAEDAGYPVVSLTVTFPQRNWEESFNLNTEEIKGINQKQILNGIGKSVAIAYKKEINAALMDLQSDGKSIFSITTSAHERQLKKITGVLSGAENSTAGDLPDTITITSSENEKVNFQYFITPDIVKYNGKRLTALYADRINNKVLKFKMVD